MKFPPFPRGLRLALLLALLAVAAFALYLDFRVRDEFEGRRFALPARVYARALELYPGSRLAPEALEQELKLLGYRAGLESGQSGRYERRGDEFELVTRPFTFWDGAQEARRLRVSFRNDRVSAVGDEQGAEIKLARLDARRATLAPDLDDPRANLATPFRGHRFHHGAQVRRARHSLLSRRALMTRIR